LIAKHAHIHYSVGILRVGRELRPQLVRNGPGHLEVGVTVDDPKAYTRPWTVTLHQRLALNTELVDEICLENEKSAQRMK
jgi:hypothetical protein